MKNKKKAVVAMSGGVDSSVTALLLKQNGYEVIGLTGKMVNTEAADTVIANAKCVADKLGIELRIYDAVECFREKVIDYFENAYSKGETPNPCIVCNEFIKWGILFDYAVNELGADIFATGHYADIRCVDGVYKLYPAKDEHKDQLYFLYRLGQKELSKTVFPLYEFQKEQVRELAYKYDLPPKSSKESQDICFIQKPNTTKKYLIDKFGLKKGDFIDIKTKEKLGTHDGCYQYTIGQRKGIGIAAPYPLYVIDINAENNIVYVGREEDNYGTNLTVNNLSFSYPIKETEFDALVKIRYNMQAKNAHVKITPLSCDCNFSQCSTTVTSSHARCGGKVYAQVEFYEPVNSVTKGQACVFYDLKDRHLIGGGYVS